MPPDDRNLLRGKSVGHDRRVVDQPLDVEAHILLGRGGDQIARMFGMGGYHRGLDRLDQLRQMAGQLDVLLYHFDRRGNGSAIRMPEHHDERRAKEVNGIFQAGEAVIVEEIAGQAHDENVARALVEEQVRAKRDCRSSSSTAAIGYCASARAARPTE